ncbi:MAG: HK97 family phage prohead protease [Selenomonadaceae bacterium]|nr:HK97 family phage prohead protease [Selenomonadaceae bacterium]MBR1730745.1 HK97 family phage prohead protease [Selenomonadaceae bacterium]
MIEKRMSEIQTENNSEKLMLVGYAIVFNKPARIETINGNSYIEIIRRTALAETEMQDVKLLLNHDINKIPLARTPKTMQLMIDDKGLKICAELADTVESRSVYEAVKRGDLSGMSFSFKVAKNGDDWENQIRTIKKIEKIYEISIVTFPAYAETTIEARRKIESEKRRRQELQIKLALLNADLILMED